jgi:hypothetical protein
MAKILTRKQLSDRKAKAARFVDNVLGDPDRADEIEEESLESYAKRRGIEIRENPSRPTMRCNWLSDNPSKERNMASNKDLQKRIKDLEAENDDLQDQLDRVADIVAPIEDDDSGDEQDDDQDDDDQDDDK